jgi:hypothetical protein
MHPFSPGFFSQPDNFQTTNLVRNITDDVWFVPMNVPFTLVAKQYSVRNREAQQRGIEYGLFFSLGVRAFYAATDFSIRIYGFLHSQLALENAANEREGTPALVNFQLQDLALVIADHEVYGVLFFDHTFKGVYRRMLDTAHEFPDTAKEETTGHPMMVDPPTYPHADR